MSRVILKMIAKLRMWYADIRGHHGKVWDYEPSDYYLGRKQGKIKHQELHDKKVLLIKKRRNGKRWIW